MPMAADEEAAVVRFGANSGGFPPFLPSINTPAGGIKAFCASTTCHDALVIGLTFGREFSTCQSS